MIWLLNSDGSSLQILSSSLEPSLRRAQAQAEPEPEAWPMPIDRSNMQNPTSSSPSRCWARAKPKAGPITTTKVCLRSFKLQLETYGENTFQRSVISCFFYIIM